MPEGIRCSGEVGKSPIAAGAAVGSGVCRSRGPSAGEMTMPGHEAGDCLVRLISWERLKAAEEEPAMARRPADASVPCY